jgi:glycosyltransferase involved in cell wall biosynthesis
VSATVKVIVPSFGYGSLLEGCVNSVLQQNGVDVRVLIIDDCSPDDTEAAARRLLEADERVEYRRHDQNLGLIPTANEGLSWAADGDCVVLLSADDLLVPGSLSRAVSVLEDHPDVGMVYGHARYFESDRPLPRVSGRWRGTRVWDGPDWIRLRCLSGHNCISSPEVVVRTEVQSKVGAYDPVCRHASDLNMWLRIASVSKIAYVKGADQALYRIHPDSMQRSMASAADGVISDLRERRAAFQRGISPRHLERADSLKRTVQRSLARQALWRASRAYDRGEIDGKPGAVVPALIEFALTTYPDARKLREWRGLKLRQRIGAGRSLWFPPFLATGAAHRLRGRAQRLRWRLQGV